MVPVTGEKVSARLGQGVEKTGGLEPERLELAVEAIILFARIAAMNGAPGPAVLATSAVRDASNGPELIERVREATGLKMRLISGEEEARTRFYGRGLGLGPAWRGDARRAMMVDLGGGSAQLVLGDDEPQEQVSLPLGSGRTTERFVRKDPPTDKELTSAGGAREVDAARMGRQRGRGRGGRRLGAVDAQDHPRRAHGRSLEGVVGGGAVPSFGDTGAGSTGSRPSGRGCCRRRSPRLLRYSNTSARTS